MKKPNTASGLPAFIQDHIKSKIGKPAPVVAPMAKPTAPLRALPSDDLDPGEEIVFDTILPAAAKVVARDPDPNQSNKPILKEEPSGPPMLAGAPVVPATNRLARLYARGVSDDFSGDAAAVLRWRAQVETLIEDIRAQGREALAIDPALDPDDLQDWIEDETLIQRLSIEPPNPKDKTDQSLAAWLKDRFALETYEMGYFYSRHYPSLRWKRHLYGKSHALEAYSTGFLYEVVPIPVLERELQRQSDLAPNFRTREGGDIGTINNQRRKNILAELMVLLDPIANGHTPKFGLDQAAGIATTETIPQWLEIAKEPAGYELKTTPVEAEHSARFAVKCKHDPAAACPTFDKFLSDSFEGAADKDEIIECLYRWLAAAVLGITYKYKRSLYCFGPTDSGKSVLLDVISSLFPSDAQTSLTFEMLNDRFSPARLVNSRLNIVREVKKANLKAGGFDSETYKTAVSGEPLEAEIKHGAHFTFSPRVAFISAANGAIPLTNEGAAVYNRISVIHFRNQVPKEDQDIYLIEKLKSETSGILNKIMNAGVRLQNERSLLDPPSSQELKKRWSSQLSSTLAWLNQVANPIHKQIPQGQAKVYTTPTAAIYKSYKNWCVVEGVKAKGKISFWTEMEALGAVRKKTKNGDRANITLRKSPQLF